MMPAGLARLFRLQPNTGPACPIGVDFSAEKLHMVQCERRENGFAVRAAVSVAYPLHREELFANRSALKKFTRRALASAPFSGRRICTALPPADVRIVPLTVNTGGLINEQITVIKALREKLRSDLADDVVDYLQVRGVEASAGELNVLAAVAPRDKVLAHLHQLDAIGLDPVALDVGPAALARVLVAMQQDAHEQSVLLVNFGIERSYVTVVWGRRLILDRELDFSEARLVAKLSSALGIDTPMAQSLLQKHGLSVRPGENSLAGSDISRTIDEILYPEFAGIAEELGRTLIYIASKTRGREARCMYLNGGLAHYPYITNKMQRLVEIPVEVLNPFSMLETAGPSAYSTGLNPTRGLALATGLALRG